MCFRGKLHSGSTNSPNAMFFVNYRLLFVLPCVFVLVLAQSPCLSCYWFVSLMCAPVLCLVPKLFIHQYPCCFCATLHCLIMHSRCYVSLIFSVFVYRFVFIISNGLVCNKHQHSDPDSHSSKLMSNN